MWTDRAKNGLSALWKWIPAPLRQRLRWAFSDKFLVGVTGIVLNARGEVLLGQHVYRSGIVWGLLGGGVQRGENLQQAMRREICEEAGLDVQVRDLLLVTLSPGCRTVDVFFWCSIDVSSTPVPGAELLRADFFSLDSLPGEVDPRQLTLIRWAIDAQASGKAPQPRTVISES
ncbi:MAG: NUDIX domain-containing protein [Anaerolineae bacterium]|nr:NUDIX domain-containing protein [Anaerolineae bacterium]